MGILRNSLIQQGVTIHNLMVFQFTYLHWYQQLEHVPMNLPIEDVLNPLYEVELQSLISDFAEDITPETRKAYTEILLESLTHIKSFMSSFGVRTADFFDQDTTKGIPLGERSGKKGKGKSKGLPKGEALEESQTKGGKSQGKRGSTNKQKEPTPSGAQGSEPKGTIDLDQQESELLTELDSLMEESVRLETLPKPTVRNKSRVRSIGTVMKDVEMKLIEISTQKEEQAASKVRELRKEVCQQLQPVPLQFFLRLKKFQWKQQYR